MSVFLAILAMATPEISAPPSRFAQPIDARLAMKLASEEQGALRTAESTIAEMHNLARTPQERALADADGKAVAAIRILVARRATLRQTMAVAKRGSGQNQLLNATKQMQETQMSFNLQYLQLQNQMQHENRSYTAISNILKTKHDTVKNSISNIR